MSVELLAWIQSRLNFSNKNETMVHIIQMRAIREISIEHTNTIEMSAQRVSQICSKHQDTLVDFFNSIVWDKSLPQLSHHTPNFNGSGFCVLLRLSISFFNGVKPKHCCYHLHIHVRAHFTHNTTTHIEIKKKTDKKAIVSAIRHAIDRP